ncbi:MAG TPA: hypothetical protein VKE22_16355, partial [Haliangiales bacterium]|nr:hypothetical protein [Haliangiales bacterium]
MALICLLCGAWDDDDGGGATCEWTQWGQSPSHDGAVCVDGQHDLRMLVRLTVDRFAAQETAETGGQLLVHYPAPLVDEDGNVFVMEKAGTYTSCDPPGSGQPAPCGRASQATEIWMQRAYEWRDGELVPQWTFASDWKPIPTPWEPMFQAAIAGRFIYIPGAGGTVFQVDKRNGSTVRRINPFGTTIDPFTWVSGGITVDGAGNIYYNVIKGEPTDARSWLVRVSRGGSIRMIDYRTLIPGAPGPTDLCFAGFGAARPVPARPWPPPPQPDGSPTLPPQFPCGSQRAGVNITPAIGRDGTIFTVTRAHNQTASNYGYIVALRPDLSLEWATSLRDDLDDGCGIQVPYGPGFFDCRPGSTLGVDPTTNLPPAGQVSDIGSSSPTALPDGGVLYGAFTGYNGFRGHLFKLDRDGHKVASYDFGWDVTPAV